MLVEIGCWFMINIVTSSQSLTLSVGMLLLIWDTNSYKHKQDAFDFT